MNFNWKNFRTQEQGKWLDLFCYGIELDVEHFFGDLKLFQDLI